MPSVTVGPPGKARALPIAITQSPICRESGSEMGGSFVVDDETEETEPTGLLNMSINQHPDLSYFLDKKYNKK